MPDPSRPTRLIRALVTLAAWIGATLIGGMAMRHAAVGSMADVVAMLSSTLMLGVVAGLAVLVAATTGYGWRDLRFVAPRWLSLPRVLWFPMLILLPFPALALAFGLPPGNAIAFMALNTALIALSEEWMFRGILFQALRERLRFWPAVIATTLGFGTLHVLNAVALGDLRMAVAQSVAATMTGLLLLALMLRTGSIWTAVVYHMLWNFGILLVAYETTQSIDPELPLPLSAYVTPMLIVLPNFLYGLVLLRHGPDGPKVVQAKLKKS